MDTDSKKREENTRESLILQCFGVEGVDFAAKGLEGKKSRWRQGGLLNYTVWMFCESDFSNEGVTEAMNESACLYGVLFYNLTPSAFTVFAREVLSPS